MGTRIYRKLRSCVILFSVSLLSPFFCFLLCLALIPCFCTALFGLFFQVLDVLFSSLKNAVHVGGIGLSETFPVLQIIHSHDSVGSCTCTTNYNDQRKERLVRHCRLYNISHKKQSALLEEFCLLSRHHNHQSRVTTKSRSDEPLPTYYSYHILRKLSSTGSQAVAGLFNVH